MDPAFHTSALVQARHVQGHPSLQMLYAEAEKVGVGAAGFLLLRLFHLLEVLTLRRASVGRDGRLQHTV